VPSSQVHLIFHANKRILEENLHHGNIKTHINLKDKSRHRACDSRRPPSHTEFARCRWKKQPRATQPSRVPTNSSSSTTRPPRATQSPSSAATSLRPRQHEMVRRLCSSCTDERPRAAPDPAPPEQGPRRPCYSPACAWLLPPCPWPCSPPQLLPPQSTEDHRRPCFCGTALEGPEARRSLHRCLPPPRLRGGHRTLNHLCPPSWSPPRDLATVRDSVTVLLG
jgi:hypothetical protein